MVVRSAHPPPPVQRTSSHDERSQSHERSRQLVGLTGDSLLAIGIGSSGCVATIALPECDGRAVGAWSRTAELGDCTSTLRDAGSGATRKAGVRRAGCAATGEIAPAPSCGPSPEPERTLTFCVIADPDTQRSAMRGGQLSACLANSVISTNEPALVSSLASRWRRPPSRRACEARRLAVMVVRRWAGSSAGASSARRRGRVRGPRGLIRGSAVLPRRVR